MHVKDMSDQVGNDGRTRASLRQRSAVARNLGENRCNFRLQCEVPIADEEAPDPAEMDGKGKKS